MEPHALKPATDFITEVAAAAFNAATIAWRYGKRKAKVSHYFLVDYFFANQICGIMGDLNAMQKPHPNEWPESIDVLRPDLRTSEGVEYCDKLRRSYGNIDKHLKNLSENPPVPQALMHQLLDQMYSAFDADPENKKAATSREVLQNAAQALELPKLGSSKKQPAAPEFETVIANLSAVHAALHDFKKLSKKKFDSPQFREDILSRALTGRGAEANFAERIRKLSPAGKALRKERGQGSNEYFWAKDHIGSLIRDMAKLTDNDLGILKKFTGIVKTDMTRPTLRESLLHLAEYYPQKERWYDMKPCPSQRERIALHSMFEKLAKTNMFDVMGFSAGQILRF